MKKILLFSLSFSAIVASAQSIKVETGKTFKMTTTVELTGEMMGNEMKNTTNSVALFKVTGAEGDFYKGTTTMTKMTVTGNMMGQDINFDSDKKEDLEGQMGQMMGSKINKAIEVKINKNTGKQEIVKTDEEAPSGMGDMMGGGDKSSGVFFVIPADKKVGDKWTETKDNEGLKEITNYEYQSLKDNVATILSNSTTKGTTTKEAMGQSMELAIDSKSTGTMTVDVSTGVIKKIEMIADSKTNMEAGGQSMEIANKTKVTTVVE